MTWMTGSGGRWMEEGRSFWRTMTRSLQRHCSVRFGGTQGRGPTEGFQMCQHRAGAVAGAAAGAAAALAVGDSIVALIQGL